MEVVSCQRKGCDGIVVLDDEKQVFLCDKCDALHQ